MSNEVNCILVGVDGAPRESQVLAVAADLAERYGAELVLFRAIGLPPEISPDTWHASGVPLIEFLERKALVAIEACASQVPERLRSRLRSRTSIATPWQGICRSATEEHADLVVIGSHGYGTLDRLLGTTAARVVNHAPCSVFVVRAREQLA